MARKTGSIQVVFDMEELNLRRTDIDVKAFRPKLQLIGKTLVKQARNKVSKTGVSSPGQYPAKQSGRLRAAIKYRIFKSGYGLVVLQDRPSLPKKKGEPRVWLDYYPSFLRYGANRKRGGLLRPRKNYIEDTGEANKEFAMQVVREAIDDSLKGIFEK